MLADDIASAETLIKDFGYQPRDDELMEARQAVAELPHWFFEKV